MFDLTSADVSRLGALLCEVKPSDLALMDPQVIPFSLQAMASCRHIPQQNRANLVQLVIKTFGYVALQWALELLHRWQSLTQDSLLLGTPLTGPLTLWSCWAPCFFWMTVLWLPYPTKCVPSLHLTDRLLYLPLPPD